MADAKTRFRPDQRKEMGTALAGGAERPQTYNIDVSERGPESAEASELTRILDEADRAGKEVSHEVSLRLIRFRKKYGYYPLSTSQYRQQERGY